MQHPAQIQAAIELTAEIESSTYPADRIMARYFKARRYIGSTDKGVIADMVYEVQRHRAALGWGVREAGGQLSPRSLMLAYLGWLAPQATPVQDVFTGAQYAPSPINEEEGMWLEGLSKMDMKDAPKEVRAAILQWALIELENAFGDMFEAECAALNERAPTDVRTNTLKTDRDALLAIFKKEGLSDAKKTDYTANGIRIPRRVPLFGLKAFKDGFFEVQDEGSQLIAALCRAKPKQMVVDFCAGAGGKSLALAANMQNKGRLQALDISQPKLKELKRRVARAGVDNLHSRPIESSWDKTVKRMKGQADVVLVDAPCSGSGTWRRSPDSKWRLTPDAVVELQGMQMDILKSASRLVKPGGRLVYATCSVLPAENSQQVAAFMDEVKGFKLLPIKQVWEEGLDVPCPVETDTLQLTPHKHGTDGFFVAVFEKEATDDSGSENTTD